MHMSSLIREARVADGLTQAQLGRRLGISQPSIARMESAGDNVTVATVRRALDAMGRALVLHAEPRAAELRRVAPAVAAPPDAG